MRKRLLVLIAFLLVVSPCYAAVAHVSRVCVTADFDDNTLQVTDTSVAAGNLLVLGVAWDVGTAQTITSVASSPANTWVNGQAQTDGPIDRVAGYYVASAASGSTTVTVTFSGSPDGPDRQRVCLHEVSGADTTSPLDANAAQGQTNPGTGSNAVTSGTDTTTVNGCYIFGFSDESNATPTYTAGTGFTLGASTGGRADEYMIQTSAGSLAATFTINSATADPTTLMMAFKPPGGAAAPPPRRAPVITK